MGTFDNQGRLLVNAWPGQVPVFLNAVDGKYYVWLPTTVDGEVTGYWQEMPTLSGGYVAKNESDGAYYRWVAETVDGEVTGRWDAV